MNLIEQRVQTAREGRNPYVICRLPSSWLVIGDVQPVKGYCLLLADPVCESANSLSNNERNQFCLDMIRVGDALLEVTGAHRINYEIYGNSVPALHAHITPRYPNEPSWKLTLPAALAHPKFLARRFDPGKDGQFVEAMKVLLVAPQGK
jgi:diadenosine tetraphosphate (Ap4A) HIT family hydrolase